MSDTYADIETIPDQREGAFERFLEEAVKSFKAPGTLSKAQAVADLGILDKGTIKALSKDEAIALWTEDLKEEKSYALAEANYRKTSFDPARGEIFSIAWAVESDDVVSLWRKPEDSEAEMLRDFFDLLESRAAIPYFIGHNIPFDLGFLFRRAVVLGVKPGFKIPFGGRHGQHFYCTSQAWTGSFNDRISQKNLSEALGFKGKPDDIDGSQVWDYVKRGEYEAVAKYNEFDVETVRTMHKRLTFQA